MIMILSLMSYQIFAWNTDILASSYPTVLAHRGCCANGVGGHAPENTILAFEYAQSTGATMFETDLRFTKDKKVIIMHDKHLDRTTNCSGKISKWTLAKIQKKCEAGSWLDSKFSHAKVPTLQDLMNFVAKSQMTVVLDLKERGLMPYIVHAANATQNLDMSQLIVSINFHDDAANVVSGLKRSTIVFNPYFDSPIPHNIKGLPGATYFGDLRETGIDIIFPPFNLVSPSIQDLRVSAARYGVQVWAWTLDTREGWISAAMAGIRTICTNDPQGALEMYQTRGNCLEKQCLSNTVSEKE